MEYEILKKAISRVLQVYENEITPEATFAGDLGADSIDMMQIMQYVEQVMDKKFKLLDLDRVVTVADGVRVMQNEME